MLVLRIYSRPTKNGEAFVSRVVRQAYVTMLLLFNCRIVWYNRTTAGLATTIKIQTVVNKKTDEATIQEFSSTTLNYEFW